MAPHPRGMELAMKTVLIVIAVIVALLLVGSGPFWIVEVGAGLGGAGMGFAGVLVAMLATVAALVIGGIVALMAGPFAVVVTVIALLFAVVALIAGLAPIVLPVLLVLAVVWMIARRPTPPAQGTLALPPPPR